MDLTTSKRYLFTKVQLYCVISVSKYTASNNALLYIQSWICKIFICCCNYTQKQLVFTLCSFYCEIQILHTSGLVRLITSAGVCFVLVQVVDVRFVCARLRVCVCARVRVCVLCSYIVIYYMLYVNDGKKKISLIHIIHFD